jgi:hypothetical protein
LLSEVERLALKEIGKAVASNKDDAGNILLNAVHSAFDEDTSLEFAAILSFADLIFSAPIFKACPTIEFYCDLIRPKIIGARRYKEFLEVLGWQ